MAPHTRSARRQTKVIALLLLSVAWVDSVLPSLAFADPDCFDKAMSAVGPTTRVRIDLADGTATQGIGLVVRGDSLIFRSVTSAAADTLEVAHPRAEILGLAYNSTREIDPHWGVIGFAAGYLVTAGIWHNANPERWDASIVGLFGGFLGAGLASFLPPLTVGSQGYVSCEGGSP